MRNSDAERKDESGEAAFHRENAFDWSGKSAERKFFSGDRGARACVRAQARIKIP
jgi:hypothetical protein